MTTAAAPPPGRKLGSKDRTPTLPPRRTQRLLSDVVRKAEAGDPVSLAVLAGAALIARSASVSEVVNG